MPLGTQLLASYKKSYAIKTWERLFVAKLLEYKCLFIFSTLKKHYFKFKNGIFYLFGRAL